MLQPASQPTSEKRWMVDRRSKKAVLHSVTSAPVGSSQLPASQFKTLIYGMSDGQNGGRVNHSVNYVDNRAPRINGKKYEGLEMAKMAQPTMRTQPHKRPKQFHPDTHDGSVLAKVLSIKLPTHTLSSNAGRNACRSSFPNPSRLPVSNANLSPLPMFNPAVFEASQLPIPEAGAPHHPVLVSLHAAQSNARNQKKRDAIKKKKRKLDAAEGYSTQQIFMPGMTKLGGTMTPVTPTLLSPLLPTTPEALWPQAAGGGRVISPKHVPAPPAPLLMCPVDPTLPLSSKLDVERRVLENKITENAYDLTVQADQVSKALNHYNKLNERAVDSLPLNYVFRKAIDKYIQTKTSSAIVLWQRFVVIHRAQESEEAYRVLQANIIQRAARCYLAKIIFKIQKRKREEYKVVCAIRIQNMYRTKKAFDVFSFKRQGLEDANRILMATIIQSKFRAFIYGSVPARRKLRVELHRALKCLAGRGPLHRVPVLPGLFASENRRFERALDIVTHPGVPFRTMATVSEARGCIRTCWKVIERRESEGKRQKDQWLAAKQAKEDAKVAALQDELKKRQEMAALKLEREQALSEAELLDREQAEAARRIQVRLEREIEEMKSKELSGSAGEREGMAREERFQRQYFQEILDHRRSDAMLELSAMETEDRYAHDLRANLAAMKERDAVAALEAKLLKEALMKDAGKPSERIRFHRKQNNNKRYFKNARNRNEYLANKRREAELLKKSAQRVPELPRPTARKREKMADFSHPPPGPVVIKKLGNSYLRLSAQPLPSQRAVDALGVIERMKAARGKYNEALKEVATERGELVRLQDELDDAEDFLVRLKARTRNERMEARQVVLDYADEVSEQQLLVDDAEADLMHCAKMLMQVLVDAAKSVDAAESLPLFKFDANKANPDTQSSTSMTAAREWLRQVAEWCSSAEAKIKLSVGQRYIKCLIMIGVIDEIKGVQNPAASDDGHDPLKYLEEAHEEGLRMLEEASLMEFIVTLNCEADYLITGYDASSSEFYVADTVVDGSVVFESECLLDNSLLPEDQSVRKCLSSVVRTAMLQGTAAVDGMRQAVLKITDGEEMVKFQESRVCDQCNARESKRIRSFIKKLLPTNLETKEGTKHAEDVRIGDEGRGLIVSQAISVLSEKMVSILKEFEETGRGGGRAEEEEFLRTLIHRAEIEAEKKKAAEKEKEEEARRKVEEEKRLYAQRHKKKVISNIRLVWMEKSQNSYELALHKRRLADLLKKQDLELAERRKRVQGKDKRMMGGGIYLYPMHSPEKSGEDMAMSSEAKQEEAEALMKHEEKKKTKGKWRKKLESGNSEDVSGEEATLLQEELEKARGTPGEITGITVGILDLAVQENKDGEESGDISQAMGTTESVLDLAVQGSKDGGEVEGTSLAVGFTESILDLVAEENDGDAVDQTELSAFFSEEVLSEGENVN